MIECLIKMIAIATLPCGCVISKETEVMLNGSAANSKHAEGLPTLLNHWIDSRIKHHQCDAVSESNPNGHVYRNSAAEQGQ